MSRSRNSRRGTRAAIQRRPMFGEELPRRLGAPTAQACRAVQAANDATAPNLDEEATADWLDESSKYEAYEGTIEWLWWGEWQERRAS